LRLLLFSIVLASMAARAATPALDYLYPAGGSAGSKFVITTGGAADPWPAQGWCDDPAVVIQAQTNKNKFDVAIGANATPGIHLVRLWNAEGSSAPRAFSIGFNRETEETEPNNNFKQATNQLQLPVTVNGRFEKHNDCDTFAMELEAGKQFSAQMEAYRLGSMMDPAMHLFDSRGKRVEFNHDFGTLDPFISYTPETSGRYYLQVMAFNHPASVNVNFYGNAAAIYRINMTQGPFHELLWPMAVQQDAASRAALKGGNLPASASAEIKPAMLQDKNPLAWLSLPGASNLVPVVACSGKPAAEIEPNDSHTNAMKLELPLSVSGEISPQDPRDVFAFEGKKDQSYQIALWSARLGSGLNCVIRILDDKGAELAKSDIQTEARDPSLNWKCKKDGSYFASISDLRSGVWRKGFYHLAIETGERDFTPTVENHSFQLAAGKTNEIPVKITRRNYDGKLAVEILGLPPEAKLLTPEVEGSPTVKVFIPESAKAWSGPATFGFSSTNQPPIRRTATFNLQGSDDEQAGAWFLPETTNIWVSVVPATKPKQ
jgi:hypothetical protein